MNFFNDPWLGKGIRLKDLCSRQIFEFEDSSCVADWLRGCSWDLNSLINIVNPEGVGRIMAHLPPKPDAGNDFLVWGASSDGIYSVKSAYGLLENSLQTQQDNLFKLIWNWRGAERVRVLMWKVALDKLPTKLWRSLWSMESPVSDFCQVTAEDTLHIFRDCSYAKRLWNNIIHPRFAHSFFNANLSEWLGMNLKRNLGWSQSVCWSMVFGSTLWLLWDWRNKWQFEINFAKPCNPTLVLSQSWRRFSDDFIIDRIDSQGEFSDASGWRKPQLGWIKLNVDGAVVRHSLKAGCGGVFRDGGGNWLMGFTREIGVCHTNLAEFWAILIGLEIAWNLGIKNIILESDAEEIISAIANVEPANFRVPPAF